MTRIAPLHPPYEQRIEALLREMMPPGQPPIGLFRTFVRNPAMTRAMRSWGTYELGPRLSLSMRERELVIDRAMALDQDEIELDDLKWVVLMVLFNQPGSEAAFAWMESQIFADDPEPVH